jgi:hypothetical protein
MARQQVVGRYPTTCLRTEDEMTVFSLELSHSLHSGRLRLPLVRWNPNMRD